MREAILHPDGGLLVPGPNGEMWHVRRRRWIARAVDLLHRVRLLRLAVFLMRWELRFDRVM